ncbi:CAMK family protein kinase [Tritrichomonas foetus]|uniref:CAMK family protein kinase n=1 Tax=Tritrichomonas foetus TaxID=1144522 RepID=A0A1J4KM35_9EUKA|nr:CAMK family protein kinase [Tritrichomonas foetus]|eukprot:OHT12361.1 CAMK family protein kinase [Tritrichomonas foetus]
MSHSRPHITGYTTGKFIGRGAFADVYIVVSQKNGTRLACKSFERSSIADPAKATKMLKQEINALKTLSHPNIIKLHSVVETETHFCVLMELCEGGGLDIEITKQKKLDEVTARNVFQQILNALTFCHSKDIAHRDLKPSNILVTKFPNIKLSDFGLSGIMGSENLMSTQCGTIMFAAPECFAGHNYNGVAADIWSSGVLLYTMLTGKIPWRGTSQIMLMNEMKKGPPPILDVSAECNQLIKMALDETPANRPSASDLLRHPWFTSTKVPVPLRETKMNTSQTPLVGLTKTSTPPVKKAPGNGPLKLNFKH